MLRHESAVKRINRMRMIDGIHTSTIDGDLDYQRTIVRSDGRVLTAFCFNVPDGSERAVEATFWTPPAK